MTSTEYGRFHRMKCCLLSSLIQKKIVYLKDGSVIKGDRVSFYNDYFVLGPVTVLNKDVDVEATIELCLRSYRA